MSKYACYVQNYCLSCLNIYGNGNGAGFLFPAHAPLPLQASFLPYLWAQAPTTECHPPLRFEEYVLA